MNRFTVVARPYLFEDLQHAAREMGALLEDRFGTGTDAHDAGVAPLQDLLSRSGSAALDQDLLHEVHQGLAAFEPMMLRGGSRRIRHLLRMFRALLEWPEKNGGTVLWNANLHLGEVHADPNLHVSVDHPKSTCYTLPIKRSGEAYWISSESYWQSFRSNRPTSLLYLDVPEIRDYEFIEFVYGQQRLRARYRRLALDEEPLRFPDSPYHAESHLAGAFFKEVGVQHQGAGAGVSTRDIYITAKSSESEFSGYPTVGWLNPLILTFDLGGSDIVAPGEPSSSRAQEAVGLYTEPDLLLACEPHVEAHDSQRIDALRGLAEQQRKEQRSSSIVERLLWGGPGPHSWRPFFLLDQIGGQFLITDDDDGRESTSDRGTEPRQRLGLRWRAPPQLAANAVWLKDLVLGTCEHIVEDSGRRRPERVLPPSVMAGFGSPHGFRRLRIESASDADGPMILDVLRAFLAMRNPERPEEALDAMLRHAAGFLDRLHARRRADVPIEDGTVAYFGEGSYQRLEPGAVLFNEVAFLEGFARHYVTPRSPVIAVLPSLEEPTACVDLVRSVAYGHKELLRRLLAASDAMPGAFSHDDDVGGAGRRYDISYRYGWWQEWFDALFFQPWDTELHFVAEREGFLLTRGRLAAARLGRADIGGRYDVEHMRI